MNVIIACERSAIVRNAFIARGHNAISCDLEDSDDSGPHYKGNIFDIINDGFDLLIGHPPCTYLTVTANKWMKEQPERKSGALVGSERMKAREESILFFMKLWNSNIPKKSLENPVGIMSTVFRKPDQIIQPFNFGHPQQKKTCLWLMGLPRLNATNIVEPEPYHITKSGKTMPKWYAYADKSKGQKERARIRSNTFPGIAKAMAEQWG